MENTENETKQRRTRLENLDEKILDDNLEVSYDEILSDLKQKDIRKKENTKSQTKQNNLFANTKRQQNTQSDENKENKSENTKKGVERRVFAQKLQDTTNSKKTRTTTNRPFRNLKNTDDAPETKEETKKAKFAKNTLKVMFLGGTGEIGKNMTVLEYGNDIIVVDAGLTFPSDDMPGVDLVIPDITYLVQNKDRVRAIFVTHGHEDHIGGLPFVLNELKCPMYGTKLTNALVANKMREHSKVKYTANEIQPRQVVKVGCFEVEALKVKPDVSVIIDGTNPKWRSDLNLIFLKIKTGLAKKAIIYTVHNTSSSDDFTTIVRKGLRKDMKTLFIGDEAHWLGAKVFRQALLPEYDYRIGLSATPSRWFDDYGTKVLVQYFGNNSFEFTIKDALNEVNPLTNKHFLVNYFYFIHKVSLDENEAAEYRRICERLSKLFFAKDNDPEAAERYERLLEKRADIIKNASEKHDVLSSLLDSMIKSDSLENLIIFVSPQQKQDVLNLLASKNIISHKLTQEEGTKAESKFGGISEREYIIKKFVSKDYKALVAIKCLDEGIDIPSASKGILMASSTNPREYIQRIGRIIRQSKGKGIASLYDISVNRVSGLDAESEMVERKIREKEMLRIKEIAENAINYADILKTLNDY